MKLYHLRWGWNSTKPLHLLPHLRIFTRPYSLPLRTIHIVDMMALPPHAIPEGMKNILREDTNLEAFENWKRGPGVSMLPQLGERTRFDSERAIMVDVMNVDR
jgi:hypothetical protein